jgi:hypothetical protein
MLWHAVYAIKPMTLMTLPAGWVERMKIATIEHIQSMEIKNPFYMDSNPNGQPRRYLTTLAIIHLARKDD